ncbi:hypothetical protein LCGC14_1032020 [marine sediment metagenome]|uniref:Uncharacterized protein n=1 Tax=marine sediment metagenome TaxID=412755 RepID=A0A0F9R0A4_9ZZZZ
MFLKIVPRGSNVNNERMLECKRYVIRHPESPNGLDIEITDGFVSSFDVDVAEGNDELKYGVVILRLDWGDVSAQDVIIRSPANVYVMSESGKTVDRFAVN